MIIIFADMTQLKASRKCTVKTITKLEEPTIRNKINLNSVSVFVDKSVGLKAGYCLDWQYVVTAFDRWLYASSYYN